jgi:hypothetical protein
MSFHETNCYLEERMGILNITVLVLQKSKVLSDFYAMELAHKQPGELQQAVLWWGLAVND